MYFRRSIKFLLLLFLFHSFISFKSFSAPRYDNTHSKFADVLTTSLHGESVDYQSLQNSPELLDEYLEQLATVTEEEFEGWVKSDQLAYFYNLYNAQTLRLIITHYPKRSIRDIGTVFTGPWDRKIVRLFGRLTTLNVLEHDIIRKDYDEPRSHFALVCAAKSCPPLRPEPYRGEVLDNQLDDQAKIFLADSSKNYFDNEKRVLYLSSIFKWFKKDFLTGSESLIEYVMPFMPEADRTSIRGKKVKIKFLDYDWTLNDVARDVLA